MFGTLVVLSALIGWLLFKPDSSAAEALTKEGAKKLIEDRYGGNVSFLQAEKQVYYAQLDIQNHSYEVKVDAKTGRILAIQWIETHEGGPSAALTEEEIREIILSNTPGELISFDKIASDGKTNYKGTVKDKNGNTTTVTVDGENGRVLSANTSPANPPRRLSEKEAIAIAQKEVKGNLDDVDLETENGQTFYLVEIKTADDREATVQIHAITGAVMSVTWDDNGNN